MDDGSRGWRFEPFLKKMPKLNDPVLVVGLPGIGNVGKVAADFIIDEIKAKPLYNVFSYELPNSVFVNEDNLVELPEIIIYYKKMPKGKQDILILTGDVQPSEEQSSYEFCEDVLMKARKLGLEKVITLGGIGLAEVPKKPALYCTGNSKDVVKAFVTGVDVNKNLYGTVGPIIGVSGIMIGLAGRYDVPAVCVLSETLGHPAYLGIKGAREIVKLLSKKLGLNIKIKHLDKEIEELEKEVLVRSDELSKVSKSSKRLKGMHETSYIG